MADPKATPLNALPRGPQGNENDTEFVKKIMNQMSTDNAESEQAYNQTQQNYQQQQFAVDQGKQHNINQQQLSQQVQYDNGGGNDQYDQQYEDEPELSTGQKFKSAIKQPILFIVLYFILCLPFVRELMVNQVGRFTQSANIQIFGSTFLLGVVGGLIFYLVNKFIF